VNAALLENNAQLAPSFAPAFRSQPAPPVVAKRIEIKDFIFNPNEYFSGLTARRLRTFKTTLIEMHQDWNQYSINHQQFQ
jgi:hypothetical protein